MTLAQERYLKTFEGALNNAARQERWRARTKEVTHHGIAVTAPSATVVSAAAIIYEPRPAASEIICACCGAMSPWEFVRLDFMRRRQRLTLLPGPLERPP